MDTVKALTVWLGASVVGSLACTVILQVATGGHLSGDDLRVVAAIAAFSLIFTMGGSGLLSLAFGWLEHRGFTMLGRYAAIVCIGGVAGAAIMLPFGTSISTLLGSSYGLATACAWILLHRLLFASR
jgi:hypothetical protein